MPTRNEFLKSWIALMRTRAHKPRKSDIAHEKELPSLVRSMLHSNSLFPRGGPVRWSTRSEGKMSLLQYKVDNAIILAAGLSRRFAPISYEQPKGLLTVRDEVLIERQIKQHSKKRKAHRAISPLVVGYVELFFYLEGKYDVDIVVNEEYATLATTVHRSGCGEGLLGNTCVCSSDDYFMRILSSPMCGRHFILRSMPKVQPKNGVWLALELVGALPA